MNVTLTINSRDFSYRLANYKVTKETSYQTVVTTLGGVEHVAGVMSRDIIVFSLFPASDETAQEDYNALKDRIVQVTYTNPFTLIEQSKRMRVDTDLEQTFGLSSVDGWRYYKGGEITLRALRCD